MITRNKILILFVFLTFSLSLVNNQFYYAETVNDVDNVFTQTTRKKDFLLGAGFFTTNAGDANLKVIKQGIIFKPTVTVIHLLYFIINFINNLYLLN